MDFSIFGGKIQIFDPNSVKLNFMEKKSSLTVSISTLIIEWYVFSKVKKVIYLEKGLTGGSKLGIDSSSEVSHLSLDAVELLGLAELELLLHSVSLEHVVSWTTFLGKTNVVLVVFLLLDLCTLMVKLARK